MALPIQVTTNGSLRPMASQRAGPFYVNGAVYVIVPTGTTARMYKAAVPSSGFTAVGTGGEASLGGINGFGAVLANGKIHVAISGNASTFYLVFDPATDTWVTSETIIAAVIANTNVDIAVRSTGEVVVARMSTTGLLHYYRRTAVNTWTAGTTVNGTNANLAGCVLGASDRIHFFYVTGTSFAHRTLDSSNTLQAEQTLGTGLTSGTNRGSRPYSFTNGTTRLIVAWKLTSTGNPTVAVADSADSPTWTTTASALDRAPNNANGPVMCPATNDTNEYVGYVDDTGSTTYDANRAKGGAFGTDTSDDASATFAQCISAATYWNGTTWKLGLLYGYDNNTRYTERTITGPVAYTDTPAASVAVTATAGDLYGIGHSDSPAGSVEVTADAGDDYSVIVPPPPPPTPLSEVIAASHTVAVLVEVLEDGEVVDELDTVIDGTVTLDQTAASRGRCDIALVDDGSLGLVPNDAGDLLAPYGNELRISRGVIHSDDTTEYVRLGVFRIETATVDDTPGSLLIRIAGLDRSARIIDARFEEPYQVTAGTNYTTAIEDVIAAAYPDVATDLTATSRTAPQLIAQEGDDRWAFAQDMAKAIGMTLYFDGDGTLVLRPVSAAGQTPVAVLAEGEDGLLVQASRGWSRQGAFNRVIATGENTGLAEPARGVATDDNPLSPTYYFGPFGKVPRFYASPLITTDDQADDAAQAILARELGTTESVDFGTIVDPTLKPDDVVRITRLRAGIDEDHLLDAVVIPLTVEGTMTGKTRAIQVTA